MSNAGVSILFLITFWFRLSNFISLAKIRFNKKNTANCGPVPRTRRYDRCDADSDLAFHFLLLTESDPVLLSKFKFL